MQSLINNSLSLSTSFPMTVNRDATFPLFVLYLFFSPFKFSSIDDHSNCLSNGFSLSSFCARATVCNSFVSSPPMSSVFACARAHIFPSFVSSIFVFVVVVFFFCFIFVFFFVVSEHVLCMRVCVCVCAHCRVRESF